MAPFNRIGIPFQYSFHCIVSLRRPSHLIRDKLTTFFQRAADTFIHQTKPNAFRMDLVDHFIWLTEIESKKKAWRPPKQITMKSTNPPTPRGAVLLIAYHYPPCSMSSGLQRTLSFSTHLEQYGWKSIVLTARESAYERTTPHQLQDIPSSVTVARTIALDAARHLAVRRRYWSRLAVPDRWRSWWLTAVPRAIALMRQHDVKVIWSTYPIATAHVIGATLARLTGVPWVADFRDPMIEYLPETGEAFPKDPLLRGARLKIEERAARRAARMVFCTDSARKIVADRYPFLTHQQLEVIPNGYEERAFLDAEKLAHTKSARRVLLHSGTIYPGIDRDPTKLMAALRSLCDEGIIGPDNFELRLRDPSNEAHFTHLAERMGIGRLVSILAPLPYREALAEMLSSDALLLLQGYTSNPAVPAKLYEYLRAHRPILALVHPDGETAATLRTAGIDTMAPLDDVAGIRNLLLRWIDGQQAIALPSNETIAKYSRQRLTEQLARTLDAVTESRRRPD
jgi:hypothetical protein